MKKIVVWSYSCVSLVLFFSFYPIAAWSIVIEEGSFANTDFGLSVLPLTFLYLFVLLMQFTIIEIREDILVIRKIGSFRKQNFYLSQVAVSYGVREKVSYKAPAIYPIYVYDEKLDKRRKIVCGDIRGADFGKFWKKYGPTEE